MAQLNLNLNPEFERDLKALMRSRKIARKSDAIRYAVKMAAQAETKRREFDALLGALVAFPANPAPRFRTEDDLWEKS